MNNKSNLKSQQISFTESINGAGSHRAIHAFLLAIAIQFSMLHVAAQDIQSKYLFPRVEQITWQSAVLGRSKQAIIIHPEVSASTASNCPVLFIFHGLGRNDLSLIEPQARNNPELTRSLLLNSQFFIVLPDGEDGFYINCPVAGAGRYSDYIDELIKIVNERYPVNQDPRHRGLAGWSMGGYGAVHFAESHPGEFGAVASIIGLLDFPRAIPFPKGQNFTIPVRRFGTDTNIWPEYDPITHIQQLHDTPLFIITADKSFDRTMNEDFLQSAKENNMNIEFKMLQGGHSFEVVCKALPLVLDFMQKNIGAGQTATNKIYSLRPGS
jgi:S-formylglutathione hydrolase FrmB